MKPENIKACIMRVGGTNCDAETQRALRELGVQAETLHLNEMIKRRNLMDYHVLVFPGGFSYGDYVRSGAIWARLLMAKLGKELKTFISDNRPVLGICNGFQVLVEEGLLPGFEGVSAYPEASLAPNSRGYKCRWVYLKHENRGNCIFTSKIPKDKVLRMPIAHGEGRFVLPKEKEKELLAKLYENDMVVFRYCDAKGTAAEGSYPANPNGAFSDIAGICNREGTVFGMMPHPERAFYWWQQPDWTGQAQMAQYGDGKLIFQSLIEHLVKRF
jgi:phosphoribosylformylglycinamidine synthase I